jgi:predicted methyltransferase
MPKKTVSPPVGIQGVVVENRVLCPACEGTGVDLNPYNDLVVEHECIACRGAGTQSEQIIISIEQLRVLLGIRQLRSGAVVLLSSL